MRPKLPAVESVIPWLEKIDASNIYSNSGPLVKQLELEYSKFFKCSPERVVVGVNATVSLQGCIQISEKISWVIPQYTFAATGHSAVASGKKIFLKDVNEKDYQLNLENIPKEFGLVPVMPFGADIKLELYSKYDCVVIDAAASLGSNLPNFNDMKKGWFIVFSLHATKVLGSGEGSVVVCGSDESAMFLRAWMNFGFLDSRNSKMVATNAKMSEITAAYGLASLSEYEKEKHEWKSALYHAKELTLQSSLTSIVSEYTGFHPYWIIQTKNESQKKAIIAGLSEFNIESKSWWMLPLGQMPAFSNLIALDKATVSSNLSKRHLGLPMWRDIPKEQIQKVTEIISKFEM